MMALILDGGVALLTIGIAAWTIRAGDDFAAVVGFVAYGLILTLAWTRLGAYDVALTEAAIGGGATGVILMRAGARVKPAPAIRASKRARIIVGGLSAAVAAGFRPLCCFHPSPHRASLSRSPRIWPRRGSATRSAAC